MAVRTRKVLTRPWVGECVTCLSCFLLKGTSPSVDIYKVHVQQIDKLGVGALKKERERANVLMSQVASQCPCKRVDTTNVNILT